MPNELPRSPTLPIPPMLFPIPAGTPASECKACGARIYFVRRQPLRTEPTCWIAARQRIVETPDAVPPTATTEGRGYSHFIDCPAAETFRAARRKGGKRT